jgi:hypothetical protein
MMENVKKDNERLKDEAEHLRVNLPSFIKYRHQPLPHSIIHMDIVD